MDNGTLILLITPILIVQLGLIVLALRDLLRADRRVRGESKLMWGIIICLLGILGPILYFVIGRDET